MTVLENLIRVNTLQFTTMKNGRVPQLDVYT